MTEQNANAREALIERAEQKNPGIAELMKLYENAEAAYRSAVSSSEAPVRVATSTNAV